MKKPRQIIKMEKMKEVKWINGGKKKRKSPVIIEINNGILNKTLLIRKKYI